MKVLFVLSHLRRGGLVSMVYNLCHSLKVSGKSDVQVLTLRSEGGNSMISVFRKSGISVRSLNCSYVQCEICTLSITRNIKDIITEGQYDIVHCHGYHSVIACAGLKNVVKVSTLHDRANEDFNNVFGPVIGRYMLHRYIDALNRFNENFAVAESTAKLYKKWISLVSYVNNGIDTSLFFPVAEEKRQALRKKLGIDQNAVVLISSGRIEKEKGYEPLIKWYVSQKSSAPTMLIILGEGSRFESCKLLSKGRKDVLLPGLVNNVEEYLQCGNYYISNSVSEGMSMAVCEGISSGLFPILSDIPSHHDVGDGIHANFFKRLDDLSIESILHKNIDRDKFHQYIENNFSIRTMTDGYFKQYCSLVH